MTDDIRHICAMEMICTVVLPSLAESLQVAIEAVQADCDIDRETAETLVHGYFQSFARKQTNHLCSPHVSDYGAIFWGFQLENHQAPGFSDDNDLHDVA